MNTKEKKFNKKYIVLIIAVTALCIFMAIGYSYFKQNLSMGGVAKIKKEQQQIKACNVMVTTEYQVFVAREKTGYEYKITLTNKSEEPIYFWTVYFEVPEDAEVTAGAATATIENNIVYLDSIGYNGYLDSEESAQFTVTINTNYEFTLDKIYVKDCDITEDKQVNDDIVVQINSTGGWGNYTYQYDVIIKNEGTTDIKGWEVHIEIPEGISVAHLWNANYVLKGTTLIATNQGHNGGISVGAEASFGMQLNTPIENFVPKVLDIIGN